MFRALFLDDMVISLQFDLDKILRLIMVYIVLFQFETAIYIYH